MNALIAGVITFVVLVVGEPLFKWVLRVFGVYAIVEEGPDWFDLYVYWYRYGSRLYSR